MTSKTGPEYVAPGSRVIGPFAKRTVSSCNNIVYGRTPKSPFKYTNASLVLVIVPVNSTVAPAGVARESAESD